MFRIMKRMSIRMRVMLPVVMVLILVCVVLTVGIYSASSNEMIAYTDTSDIQSNSMQRDGYTHMVITESSGVMEGILKRALGIMAFCILIGIIGVWLVVKFALRPVTDLSRQIAEINEAKLSEPIPTPLSNDEIAKLVVSFNHMLERLNSAFETQKNFSATAAHELKTPLSSIIANVEVLELDEQPSFEECMETIALIKESSFRMEKLVQDLLQTYCSYTSDKTEICNIRLLCQKACEEQKASDSKDISYEIQGELLVKGEIRLLERAVGNLISNAFRYNKEKGNIVISLSESTLCIKDNGIGIKESDIHQIFEPFYRADSSRSRSLGGSGLGLAIVKQIFDHHNARIWVKSKIDVGTTITVIFDNANTK